MRTYANDKQIAGLSKWLFEQGFRQGQAKAFLEPKQYQVKGINFGYREVDACLALMDLLFGSQPTQQPKQSKPRASKPRTSAKPAQRIGDMVSSREYTD